MATDFKGFDDWITVSLGGPHKDSNGIPRDGDKLIDSALALFDKEEYKPPIVIGHPKDNAPAYGWTGALKEGPKNDKGQRTLQAKFQDVYEPFENMVKQNLLRYRSSSFGPNGELRHIGFLGAVPPAMKGMPEVAFKDVEEVYTIDFSDRGFSTVADIFRKFREWLIDKNGIGEADKVISGWDIDYLLQIGREENEDELTESFNEPLTKEEKGMEFKDFLEVFNLGQKSKESGGEPAAPGVTSTVGAAPVQEPVSFTEAEHKAAIEQAQKEAKDEAIAEFAKERTATAKKTRDKGIKEFCDKPLKEGGCVLPAWREAGIQAFMEAQDGETSIEFAAEHKGTQLEWFRGFVEGLGKTVDFSELATRGKDMGDKNTGEMIDALTKAKQKENKGMSFAEALTEVQIENPELAKKYVEESGMMLQ